MGRENTAFGILDFRVWIRIRFFGTRCHHFVKSSETLENIYRCSRSQNYIMGWVLAKDGNGLLVCEFLGLRLVHTFFFNVYAGLP